MARTLVAALAAAALVIAHPTPSPAAGDGQLRLEVLVDGIPVSEHHARGTTYVEALRGHEYSVRLTNLEPVRVAVALAVDGRNSIDAKRTSAASARKWILEPWQSIVIDGWQSDERTAHRFVFTTEDRSYAEWLGDSSQAGVIEAVAYRERQPRWHDGWFESKDDRYGGPREQASRDRSGDPAAAAPPSARAEADGQAGATLGRAAQESKIAKSEKRPSDEAAATGFGRGVSHDVRRVEFDAESRPSSTVRVRYEYRDALVRLGVVPEPRPVDTYRRRETARGFTDSYCPVPPGR